MNRVNQSSPRPANTDNKTGQNITRFCPYCRRNGHTLMYCRTKAHDDEIKKQQTRNNQERQTCFTHDYSKRTGPNFGSQNLQNFNQQPRFGNQNNQTPYRQTSFSPDGNRIPNSDGRFQLNRPSNYWSNGPNNRQPTQYSSNARPDNSNTQYKKNFPQSNNLPTPNSVQFIDDQGQDVVNTWSASIPSNFWSLRDQMKKVTSNHVFRWTPSTFPPETAKKIVDSKLSLCSTLVQLVHL